MELLLPLGLQPGHVNVGGALSFAGFAREAEVHRAGDLWLVPRIGDGWIGKRLPQHVGPGPGRVASLRVAM